MTLRNKLEFISNADFTRIHEASLKVLAETGVAFHSEEALEIFRKHGAKVDGKIVYMTKAMVEKALETAPSRFEWVGRNPEQSVIVGEGFIRQPNVGPVYIQDLDNGRRAATIKDFANIQKLCQASDVVELVGSIPVTPSDLPAEYKHLSIMYETLKNSDKPLIGMTAEGHQVREQLEMVAMAMGGREFLEQNHCVGVLVNPLSPLGYAPETLDTIIEYSKLRQPLMLAPCLMAGVSAPITQLGAALLQNIEILAGLVLSQLVNPGTPVVYSVASTSAYFRRASFSAGTPEAMMINTINLHMGRDFYHMPTRTMCGITESKVVDAQAGYESMMSVMLGMMSGANIGVQCLGVLDGIMTTSYEKFIIDEEMIRRVKRVEQGVDTSDTALAVEVIQEIGQNGSYLTHQSTFEHFRECWTPTISEWGSYDDWMEKGGEDVAVRANRRFKEILAAAPETMLESGLDKSLQQYVQQKSVK